MFDIMLHRVTKCWIECVLVSLKHLYFKCLLIMFNVASSVLCRDIVQKHSESLFEDNLNLNLLHNCSEYVYFRTVLIIIM